LFSIYKRISALICSDTIRYAIGLVALGSWYYLLPGIPEQRSLRGFSAGD